MEIKNVMFFSGKTAKRIIEIFKYQESDTAHKKNLISIQKPMTHWNTAHKLEVKTKGYQVIRFSCHENHCALKPVTKSKPSLWSLSSSKSLISKSFVALTKKLFPHPELSRQRPNPESSFCYNFGFLFDSVLRLAMHAFKYVPVFGHFIVRFCTLL